MKNLSSNLLTGLVCTSLIVFASCRAAVVNNCEKNSQKVTDAVNAYASDPTNKTKCEAYKSALQDYINSSCFTTYGTATYRKSLQNDLQNMKCI